jgi:hypothetical protein
MQNMNFFKTNQYFFTINTHFFDANAYFFTINPFLSRLIVHFFALIAYFFEIIVHFSNLIDYFSVDNSRYLDTIDKKQMAFVQSTTPIPSLLSTLAKRSMLTLKPNFAKELISPSHANTLCKGITSIEKIDYI